MGKKKATHRAVRQKNTPAKQPRRVIPFLPKPGDKRPAGQVFPNGMSDEAAFHMLIVLTEMMTEKTKALYRRLTGEPLERTERF